MQNITWNYILEKWNNVGFQKYFRNMGWMFFGRIFMLGISFLVNAYIARYLGPANYGLLNYTISFVGLFGFIASFGIDNIVNREIIKNHDLKSKIIGTSFYLKLIGGILAIIAIYVTSYFTTTDGILLGLIWMFSLTYIFQAFNIVDIYFQSQVLSKYSIMITIIGTIISTALKIYLITSNSGIIWLTAIYTLETAITAIGFILIFIYKGHKLKEWIFDKKIAIMILKDSWPLMLSSIAIGIYMKIDQVMIKNMIGNQNAGLYAIAVKLSEVWYFLPSIICISIFPAIVNAKKVSVELYEKRLKKLYFLMFWLSFLIALFASIFAYPIIYWLFGIQYLGAITALRIYIWAGISVSLGIAIGQYLLTENYTKIPLIGNFLGAILNVILNLFLIPKYGIAGAAFATLISYSLSSLAGVMFSKTRHQLKIVSKSIFYNPFLN
jgi:O-antigen/teichoic acid export membrane protein